MGMAGPPQILAERIFHVGGITDEEAENAHAPVHHGGQDDQKKPGPAAGLTAHNPSFASHPRRLNTDPRARKPLEVRRQNAAGSSGSRVLDTPLTAPAPAGRNAPVRPGRAERLRRRSR